MESRHQPNKSFKPGSKTTHLTSSLIHSGHQHHQPDLNPLYYAIWSKLEAKVCSKPHTSVEALKRSLTREWETIPIETLRASVEDWRPRLEQCIAAGGGNFEH